MKTSEQTDLISKSMVKIQGSLQGAEKDNVNPIYKSKSASLGSLRNAIRIPCRENNVFCSQEATTTKESVSVVTRFTHESGQYMEYEPYTIYLQKFDAHAHGSGTTYACKYSLKCALGISDLGDDDDGNGAVDRSTGEVKPPVKQTDPSHIPLTDHQKQKISALIEAIKDTAWLKDLASKAKVNDLTQISAERFEGLIANLEKKVGG